VSAFEPTYREVRGAKDLNAELTFAAKMGKSAFKRAASAPADLEEQLGLDDGEKLIWRLMKIPRRYADLETAGGLAPDEARRFLRALVACQLVELLDGKDGRAVVPLELSRLKRELSGKSTSPPAAAPRKPIQDRVFRPDITGGFKTTSSTGVAHVDESAADDGGANARSTLVESALSASDRALKREIDAAYDAREGRTFYEVLGLDPKASANDVKAAYMKLVRKWHPDAISGTALADDTATRAKVDALFKQLQEAHATLSDQGSRNSYDQHELARQGASASSTAGGSTKDAAVLYHKGDNAMNAKNFVEAETRFRQAAALDPDNLNIKNALGWAIYLRYPRTDAEHLSEARNLLSAALAGGLADAAYKLGLIARNERHDEEAIKRFRECLKLLPRHASARKELEAAMERERRHKEAADFEEKSQSSLFGGLFKKK